MIQFYAILVFDLPLFFSLSFIVEIPMITFIIPSKFQLYKNSGEDDIQLFDLSVIPKNHSSNDCDDTSSSLPSLLHRGRSDSLYSLGTLLYRSAHRLSLSVVLKKCVYFIWYIPLLLLLVILLIYVEFPQVPKNMAKCARFFQKCLEFLDEPDHLVPYYRT